MKKILLLGSLHGNELLGKKLYDYITEIRPDIVPHVRFKIGNIKAYRKNVRQIESDMNRSYTGGTTTYEERRAATILRYIRYEAFDLVIDLHTTTCLQPPCIIIPRISDYNRRFINSSSIDKIVLMPDDISKTSLIGVCPMAVSIEVNNTEITEQLMDQFCNDIERYIHNTTCETPKTIYEIKGFLNKNEISDKDVSTLRNFEYCSFGFYPILVGENSYKKYTKYLGFKAHKTLGSRL